MDSSCFRIAHLSDLHFFCPSWNPRHCLSSGYRSFCAQLHTCFSKSRKQIDIRNVQLSIAINELGPFDLIIISGDITTKGCQKECAKAITWLEQLPTNNLVIVPGNHDYFSYYKKNEWPFIKILQRNISAFSIDNFLSTSVCSIPLLKHNWTIVCVNLANPEIGHSQGIFPINVEHELSKQLESITTPCIVVGHFPPYPRLSHRKTLIRANSFLQTLIKYPSVQLYLHGHTHENHHRVIPNRDGSLISLDSGTALIGNRTTFGVYQLSKNQFQIDRFFHNEKNWSLEGSFFTEGFHNKLTKTKS